MRDKPDWRYIDETTFYYGNNKNTPVEEKEFSYTSAHELGHSILKAIAENANGSTDFSYQHKGSSDYSDALPIKDGGENYPTKSGEIDLMKYYNNDPYRYDYDRIVASENDVLGLIWLTKIVIK